MTDEKSNKMPKTADHFVKVGTVKKNAQGNIVVKDGLPQFNGQRIITASDALKGLPFWYPIIPEFYSDADIAKLEHGKRYYGIIDLDIDTEDIKNGHVKLFTEIQARAYESVTDIKQDLSKFLQTNKDSLTFGQVCEAVSPLKNIALVTQVIVNDLHKKGVTAFAFFTGLKGTRVLWYDPVLWRKVFINRRDAGDSGLEILSDYLSPEVSQKMKECGVQFDASVYGKGKGIKPDILPHPFSKMGPIPLYDDKDEFCLDFRITQSTVPDLENRIRSFWETVMTSVPADPPLLVTGKPLKLIKRVTASKDVKARESLDNRRVEGLMSLAVPDAPINFIKELDIGQYLVVLASDQKYCHIAQTDHSATKSYYLVDTTRGAVKQKCHAGACHDKNICLWPKAHPLTKEDFAYFEYQLLHSDMGLANVFVSLVKNDVKVVEPKSGECYIYNEKNALWEQRPGVFCANMISSVILPVLEGMLEDKYAEVDKLGYNLKKLMEEFKEFEDKKKILSMYEQTQLKENIEKTRESYNTRKKSCDKFTKQQKTLYKTSGINAAFNQAKTMLVDRNFENQVDRIPYLLPISNKRVVDLRDGTVHPRTRDHKFSFESSVDYSGDLNQPTPLADKFFLAVMCNSHEDLEDLRWQLGYCLTGETKMRSFFMWWGPLGSNAKGTIASFVQSILSKFYTQISKHVAMECTAKTAGNQATPHLMPLMKARVAMMAESSPDDKLNEELVKTWTGNDPLSVRQLYGEQQVIQTQAKLVIQTNNKPAFSGQSYMIDRTILKEFRARFTDSGEGPGETKRDYELVEKLKGEYLHEVFIWILRGSVKWYANNGVFKRPDKANLAMTAYVDENDLVGNWLQSCTVTGLEKSTARVELYKHFQAWCDSNLEAVQSSKSFYSVLLRKGYIIGKGGDRLVKDLRIKI
jgi:P4 family phage/plasmid primase-like protien